MMFVLTTTVGSRKQPCLSIWPLPTPFKKVNRSPCCTQTSLHCNRALVLVLVLVLFLVLDLVFVLVLVAFHRVSVLDQS